MEYDGMQYVLSLSYGKDSLACLGAIEKLGLPLDRIIHAEVWATDAIPADPPPMVEFKAKADRVIKERWGISTEHVYATRNGKKLTYQDVFYKKRENSRNGNTLHKIYGWPFQRGAWCNDRLKVSIIEKSAGHAIHYVGIATDEPERLARLSDVKKISPLETIGWTEADCLKWCKDNDLLSPLYTTATRGGCWFCHNQGVDQLRQLRHNYPEYWTLMLKWDRDSPVTFKPDGHTVHDFDRRFRLEDEHLLNPDNSCFRWSMLHEPLQYKLF